MAGGVVSAPATRTTTPDPDDAGTVTRPIITTPIPVVIGGTSTLHPGVRSSVGAIASLVLPANAARATALVKNVGASTICVGPAGVTPATGLPVAPGETAVYDVPDVYQGEIWAVRQDAVDGTAFAQEATTP